MENRAGYKKTELGWIPEEWDLLKLKNIIELMTDYVANGSFKALREHITVHDNDNYAIFVRLFDLRIGLGHSKQKYVDKISYDFLSKSNLYGNEILMANIGANVGEVFLMPLIDKPATIAPNMIIIKPSKNSVDNKYLFLFFKSDFGIMELNKIIAGSGHPKINKTELKTVNIILPPLPEQQKIASILTTVDDKISSIEAQIQQTEQLKKGLMAKLLTEGIGHTEFKDTEIGRIPESWEVKILIDAAEKISDGIHTTPKYCPDTEYYFINGNNLSKGNIVIDEKTKCVSRSEFLKHKKELNLYTILLSINGTIGNLAFYNNEKVILGKSASYIILSKHIDKQYVYYLLQTDKIQKYFLLEVTGTTIKNLSIKSIKNCKIPLPPLPEQQQIASILSSVDDKLDVLQSKKTSYSTLKKGLMAKLLTGQMRVKI
ncbi:MAG: restriction endonuclease subunit S [Desulfamplus sp.]|nr:restriction endonuclease subunit S [Desulfamplus sp.]